MLQQLVPPELWRECIRWATLPSSGRLPLSAPPTCLTWFPGCMASRVFTEAPDFSYAYEQHQVYPTKRALMLVCKDWMEIAAEFLYESILVDLYDTGSAEKLEAVLRIPGRGSRLAWWVKSADMNAKVKDHVPNIIQELCPNLRVLRMFTVDRINEPLLELEGVPFLHPRSHLTTLSVTPTTLSTVLRVSPSTLDYWRYLTIIVDDACTSVPILPQLLSLTIVPLYSNDTPSFAAIGSWSCPLLTHLSIHFWNESDDGFRLVEHFGPQLTFFALTILEPYIPLSTLDSCLKAMPNLKELVTPPLSNRVTPAEQGPLRGFRHESIQVVGFPVHSISNNEVDSHSAAYAQTARLLFPNLRAMRITSAQRVYTAAHCRKNPFGDRLKYLTSLAHILEEVGVVLEDPAGEDVRSFILERG